jgi:hypothetical protein
MILECQLSKKIEKIWTFCDTEKCRESEIVKVIKKKKILALLLFLKASSSSPLVVQFNSITNLAQTITMDQIKLLFGNNQTCLIVSATLQYDSEDNSFNKIVAGIVHSINKRTRSQSLKT